MIRPVTQKDALPIYRLLCELEECTLDFGEFFRIFTAQRERPGYRCLVFEGAQGVGGFLNLRIEEQLHHGGSIAEILELAVSPALRRGGIGAALLCAARQLAREEHCRQIEVCCNLRRADAHRFYLREGMEKTHYKFCHTLD